MVKIALDAGHYLGTAGKRTPDGIKEFVLNNAVCNYIEEYLKGYVEIIRVDDRTGNADVSLADRRNKAIQNGCIVLISTHHNALNDDKFSNVTGTETFTHSNYENKQAKELAELLAKNISEKTGLKNRGAKQSRLAVIATSKIPAILCEGGFMDGEKDSYYIRSEEGQKAYAQAVAETLIQYFDLKKDNKVVEQVTSTETKKQNIGIVATIQSTLNSRYNLSIAVDNIYGKETKKALIIGLQTELNKQYKKGLDVDGIFGNLTKNACVSVRKGAKGNITWILQAILICRGYKIALDADFGANTEKAVKDYQSKNALTVDGICSKNTFAKLFN